MAWSISFEGCHAKIERALHHLDTLEKKILAARGTDNQRAVVEPNADGTSDLVFHADREPPILWGIIVGDAMHNLRSALDIAVYELSGHRPGTSFPISLSADDYFKSKSCGRPSRRKTALEGVPTAARSIIDNAQPFHRLGERSRDPLARLAVLNNADKHRVIQAAVALWDNIIDVMLFEFINPAPTGEISIKPLLKPPVALKDGTKLCRITTTQPVQVKGALPARIAFGKGSRFVDGNDLRVLAEYVQDLVARLGGS